MATDFQTCYNWTMGFEDRERKYEAVPDPGGSAISGINSHYWPAEYASIAAIPQAQRGPAVENFYLCKMWKPIIAQLNDVEIGKRYFDSIVNLGDEEATLLLQRAIVALGYSETGTVRVDGVIGPLTVAAANEAIPDRLVTMFKELRAAHYLENKARLPQSVVNELVARARA
jgi:lysozyme family protein